MNSIEKANKVFLQNFRPEASFERAVFLSWYCSRADCKFCYMSLQKNFAGKKARRKRESILAEAFLCKKLGWNIEFLSGGYESHSSEELLSLLKNIYKIYGKKLWLNIGVIKKEDLVKFKPFVEGIVGAVECINPKIQERVCPSKPIGEIIKMFEICNELKLKKRVTIIIGLGEKIGDFELLKDFIKKHKIDRVTFYALNPHKGTIFKKGPDRDYYAEWIAETRISFPKLEITAGSWVDRLDEISLLLKAGANNITKFPAIKLFNTKYTKEIELQVKRADREFKSKMSGKIDINFNEIDRLKINSDLKEKIKIKLQVYVKKMESRS